jgi:hypothetical protein
LGSFLARALAGETANAGVEFGILGPAGNPTSIVDESERAAGGLSALRFVHPGSNTHAAGFFRAVVG